MAAGNVGSFDTYLARVPASRPSVRLRFDARGLAGIEWPGQCVERLSGLGVRHGRPDHDEWTFARAATALPRLRFQRLPRSLPGLVTASCCRRTYRDARLFVLVWSEAL